MIRIALQSLLNRKGTVILTLVSITLCVGLLIGVQRLRTGIKDSFGRTVSGVDLIVGPRTSGINLLLYSVFHIGNPINTVDYQSYLRWANRDEVSWSFPLALGDSHKGYRVVGTTNELFERYRYAVDKSLEFSAGENFSGPFDVVLGSDVALALMYSPGDPVIVTHGIGEAAISRHDNLPFTVKGVLDRTGTPLDRSLFVPLEGLTAIHAGWETGREAKGLTTEAALNADLTPGTVTAFFLGLNRRSQVFQLQRQVNSDDAEPLSAILPGVALYELWSMMSLAERSLAIITVFVVFVSLIGMLITEVTALQQRQREMALFRSLGAGPAHLFLLLFAESAIITTAGCLSGLLLIYPVQILAEPLLSANGLFLPPAFPTNMEFALLLGAWGAGLLIGLAPAFIAYRKGLHENLIPKT